MTFSTRKEMLQHWRDWAALFDPHPEDPPQHDNDRRARVNWWIEMAEAKRQPSTAFLKAAGDTTGHVSPRERMLAEALHRVASYAEEEIEKALAHVPGEPARLYQRDPEWVVLEDIRDAARHALKEGS